MNYLLTGRVSIEIAVTDAGTLPSWNERYAELRRAGADEQFPAYIAGQLLRLVYEQ